MYLIINLFLIVVYLCGVRWWIRIQGQLTPGERVVFAIIGIIMVSAMIFSVALFVNTLIGS